MPDKSKTDTSTIRPNIANSMRAEDLRKGIAALDQGFMNGPRGVDPDAYEKAVVSSVGAYLGQRGIEPPAEAMVGREALSKFMFGEMDQLTTLPPATSSEAVTTDTSYNEQGLPSVETLHTLKNVSRTED